LNKKNKNKVLATCRQVPDPQVQVEVSSTLKWYSSTTRVQVVQVPSTTSLPLTMKAHY